MLINIAFKSTPQISVCTNFAFFSNCIFSLSLFSLFTKGLLPIVGSICRLRMTSKFPFGTMCAGIDTSKYQAKRNTYELWTSLCRLQYLLPIMKLWFVRTVNVETDRAKKAWSNKINKVNYEIDKYQTWVSAK